MRLNHCRVSKSTWIVGILAVVVLIGVPGAHAGKVSIGDQLPDFSLNDYSGKTHKLSDYQGKIVVLNFCSHKCPWSLGADPEINRIATEYAEKGVVFLGIDSHNNTPPSELKEHAESGKVPYPILKDEKNVYADAVGAQRTPEIYIANKEGKLVYHGAFDSRTKPEEKGAENYVTAALDAVLAGKPVEKAQTAAWGCTIKRVEAQTSQAEGTAVFASQQIAQDSSCPAGKDKKNCQMKDGKCTGDAAKCPMKKDGCCPDKSKIGEAKKTAETEVKKVEAPAPMGCCGMGMRLTAASAEK